MQTDLSDQTETSRNDNDDYKTLSSTSSVNWSSAKISAIIINMV